MYSQSPSPQENEFVYHHKNKYQRIPLVETFHFSGMHMSDAGGYPRLGRGDAVGAAGWCCSTVMAGLIKSQCLPSACLFLPPHLATHYFFLIFLFIYFWGFFTQITKPSGESHLWDAGVQREAVRGCWGTETSRAGWKGLRASLRFGVSSLLPCTWPYRPLLAELGLAERNVSWQNAARC